MKFISVEQAIEKKKGSVDIRGWIYRIRKLKDKVFIVLRDSSEIIQCIVKDPSLVKISDKLLVESSIEISGKIYKDKRAPTGYEIEVKKLNIVHVAEDFPIGKDQSPEFLLDKRHLYLRSRKLTASLKIRSNVLWALQEYIRKLGFIEAEAPSFSGSASEGGSEVFEFNYFGKKAFLTQSWQFYAENFIFPFEKVYALAPSFRAEKSKTSRHLTEFWHLEIEQAWANVDDLMNIAEKSIEYTIKEIIKKNKKELELLNVDITNLKKIKTPFPRIKHSEAIKLLNKKGFKIKKENDLGTLEEKALTEHFGTFLFVTNYPLKILKFYHGEDPKEPKTGMNFNLLAPKIGEVVDGSQREPDLNKIKERLKKDKIALGAADWYLDSRRFGSVPHAGFGLGTERLIQFICNLDNIKDAIPFPRTMTRLTP
jgi:asparaginyl-tRNA synthetase